MCLFCCVPVLETGYVQTLELFRFVTSDENIDETYGINVQFEESEEEVCVMTSLSLFLFSY